jgi:hypothetical protein
MLNHVFEEIIPSLKDINRTILLNDVQQTKFFIEDKVDDYLVEIKQEHCMQIKSIVIYKIKPSKITPLPVQDQESSFYKQSKILTDKYMYQIMLELCHFPKEARFKNIYTGSRDQFCCAFFHQNVDCVPNTLVLVRSQNENVFGGFTELTWDRLGSIEF